MRRIPSIIVNQLFDLTDIVLENQTKTPHNGWLLMLTVCVCLWKSPLGDSCSVCHDLQVVFLLLSVLFCKIGWRRDLVARVEIPLMQCCPVSVSTVTRTHMHTHSHNESFFSESFLHNQSPLSSLLDTPRSHTATVNERPLKFTALGKIYLQRKRSGLFSTQPCKQILAYISLNSQCNNPTFVRAYLRP